MPSWLFRASRVAHVQLDQGTDPKPTPLSSIGFTSNSLNVSSPVSKPDARMRVVHVQLDKSLRKQGAAMPRIRLNRLLRTSPVRFRATKEIPTWQAAIIYFVDRREAQVDIEYSRQQISYRNAFHDELELHALPHVRMRTDLMRWITCPVRNSRSGLPTGLGSAARCALRTSGWK